MNRIDSSLQKRNAILPAVFRREDQTVALKFLSVKLLVLIKSPPLAFFHIGDGYVRLVLAELIRVVHVLSELAVQFMQLFADDVDEYDVKLAALEYFYLPKANLDWARSQVPRVDGQSRQRRRT